MLTTQPGPVSAEHQVAVLIDFENVGLNSIQWLLDQVSDVGRISVKRAYADWSVAGSKRDQLLQLGIEPIHVFHSGSGKNTSDIRLTIDAIDLLYQSAVDTLVIASSDADFVPLVSRLRAAGRSVIGAGRRRTTSRTLVISCDRFLFLDQADEPQSTGEEPAQSRPEAESLLVRAVRAAMDDHGRVVGSKLHQTLERLDPSFNFRDLGYSTFTRFLEDAKEVRATRPSGPSGQGDVMIELAESAQGGTDDDSWAPRIDAAWSNRATRAGQSVTARTAAAAAARALGVSRLSDSSYKTLQKVIDSNDLLRQKWRREGQRVIRR